MKITNFVFSILVIFCSANLAMADSFSGFAKKYDALNKPTDTTKEYKTKKELPNVFYSGRHRIIFEKTTIANIKDYFGGTIKKNNSDSWVCYSSKSEGITYWFISAKLLENGYLSTVIFAPLDKKSKCNIPLHAINLKSDKNIPLLYSSRTQAFKYLGLKINKTLQSFAACKDSTIPDKKVEGGFIQSNCAQYFFNKDKTVGVFISQVTTN